MKTSHNKMFALVLLVTFKVEMTKEKIDYRKKKKNTIFVALLTLFVISLALAI